MVLANLANPSHTPKQKRNEATAYKREPQGHKERHLSLWMLVDMDRSPHQVSNGSPVNKKEQGQNGNSMTVKQLTFFEIVRCK